MMAFFLAFFLITFNAKAGVRELAPIKKESVIRIGEKNYGKNAGKEKKVQIAQIKEKKVAESVEIMQELANFKTVTTEKHDWKEKLKEINKVMDDVKRLLSKTKNPELAKKYDVILTELIFYRGVVNLHLKNYGLAVLDMRYVVKKDESYLERKPVLEFEQSLTLDEVMKALWKYLRKLDDYYCDLGLNKSNCHEKMDACYAQHWTNSCHQAQFPTEPYNNDDFIDIQAIIRNHHFNAPCLRYCIFINKDNESITRYGSASLDDKCKIFTTEKSIQYLQQITKYKEIGSGGKKEVEDYFCRGFSNIMLIGEGTTISNKEYINNAKADIKTAIEKNNALPTEEQVVELEDDFVTEIFNKYNQFVTKDMTQEQLALINSAVSKENLQALKATAEDNAQLINESIIANDGLVTNPSPSESLFVNNLPDEPMLNNTGYSTNALQNITNIQGITTNTTTNEQKTNALLKGSRPSQTQAKQAEANLQTMLEMIENLQTTGDY